MFNGQPIQLSFNQIGHTLNTAQVFSPDGKWVVFDCRNSDGEIKTNGSIGIIDILTGEERIIYTAPNQTVDGPGVGAASFSPIANRVIFIHGLQNASAEKPYDFTRRTGVAVDIENPQVPIFMDARNVRSPYTVGALRGGTHAHSWRADGQMISFTYNDEVIAELGKKNATHRNLRTIGVMFPKRVEVPNDNGLDNFSGEMYAVLVATVCENPIPGSDEIDKAFDECWIGKNGYITINGTRQQRAIAFQGNVKNADGRTVTEVFVTGIDESLTTTIFEAALAGTKNMRPLVPKLITQRRITFTEKGVNGPRHWLRSNAEGTALYFLAADDDNLIQAYEVSPNGGEIRQVTKNNFSILGPINISPDDLYLSYIADESVFITEIIKGVTKRLTPQYASPEQLSGAVVWSNDGEKLVFNKYVEREGERWLQLFLLRR